MQTGYHIPGIFLCLDSELGLRELKPRIFVLLAVELWEIARLLCASVTPNVTGEWN